MFTLYDCYTSPFISGHDVMLKSMMICVYALLSAYTRVFTCEEPSIDDVPMMIQMQNAVRIAYRTKA